MFTAVESAALDRRLDIKIARAGDVLHVNWRSIQGTFDRVAPILVAQFFTTGSPPGPYPGISSVQINPFVSPGPFAVFDGNNVAIPVIMPPGGLSLSFLTPPGLVGNSVLFQGMAVSPLSKNGIFATTHAHEFRFRP